MKRIIFLIALMWLTIGTWAQHLTEQQAKERALQYLNEKALAKTRGLASAQLKSAKVGAEKIYAFNREGGGYVIASGDERTLPVLGYSDSGTIDWERMPKNMQAWLKQYDEAIATLGKSQNFVDGNSKRGLKTRTAQPAIEPLIKTQWDQDAPYWDKIPLYDGADTNLLGQPCPTGCVATAMAQIMNYHQWPKAACEPIPEYEYMTAHENQEKMVHFDALPPTTFDWDNMMEIYRGPDGTVLGTEAQQEAVATLMLYCGQSVYMEYNPLVSLSDHQQVAEALIKYFGYKNTARCLNRIQYSIDGWENLIYSELAAGRPIQYGGLTDNSGHSFICDGYDGNGLFHINWGWGGDDDGFFSLAVLNPYNNSSTGASSSGIGFCIKQDMVIGIEPDVDGTSPKLAMPQAYLIEDNSMGVIAADSVFFNYLFISFTYDNKEAFVKAAMGTVGDDGVLTPIFMCDPADTLFYSGRNSHVFCIDSSAFEPGEELRLCPMVKFYNIPGADWQLLGAPDEYYFVAGRTPEGKFYLYRDLVELELIKAEFTRGLGRIGMRNDLTLTIRNHSPFESTQMLMLVPYYYGHVKPEDITDETPYSEGDSFWTGGYLRAGQDSEATFCFKPLASGTIGLVLGYPDGTLFGHTYIEVSDTIGSYDDYLRNDSYYELTPGKVVYHVCMKDNPEATIPQGKPDENIYLMANIGEIGCEPQAKKDWLEEAIDYLTALPEKGGDGTYMITKELTMDVEPGKSYYVASAFVQFLSDDPNDSDQIVSANKYEVFTVDETGIVHVIREVNDSDPYYDLQGRRLQGQPSRKGLYIRNGKKVIKSH